MDRIPSRDSDPLQDSLSRARRRRRTDTDPNSNRRSTHACHRCKNKKLKCHHAGDIGNKCVACNKANSDCVYDVAPDGIPRGAAYIASLEARVASLEFELAAANSAASISNARHNATHNLDINSEVGVNSSVSNISRTDEQTQLRASRPNATLSLPELVESSLRTKDRTSDSASDITIFNMLQRGPSAAELVQTSPSMSDNKVDKLADLPSSEIADHLVETVFLYTQARYCIVDWVQLRKWHNQREAICYSTRNDAPEAQIGAYFLWMIYAIGADFVQNPEYPPKAYFIRALEHFQTVIDQRNLITVQALLTLVQYEFRATGGPSVWHIVGFALRLCIELDFHRKSPESIVTQDPYKTELQKRFFWCTYCFDRLVSMLAKRPFGLHDSDIDIEIPVNIDVTCTDSETIRDLQMLQVAGEESYKVGSITTMSAALHHLEMYRLRSRILTRLTGPSALPPTNADVMGFVMENQEWKRNAPRAPVTPFPVQSDEQVQATYFDTILFTMRPVLMQPSVDQEILALCAKSAAEACENSKVWNLSPRTHHSLSGLYFTFYCGITLLHCIVLQPTILTPRQTLRAILACSSALAVITRTFSAAAPFLEIFDKISDEVLNNTEDSTGSCSGSLLHLRTVLQQIMSSNPAKILELLGLSSDGNTRTPRLGILAMGNPGLNDVRYQQHNTMMREGHSGLTMGNLEAASDLFAEYSSYQELGTFWNSY